MKIVFDQVFFVDPFTLPVRSPSPVGRERSDLATHARRKWNAAFDLGSNLVEAIQFEQCTRGGVVAVPCGCALVEGRALVCSLVVFPEFGIFGQIRICFRVHIGLDLVGDSGPPVFANILAGAMAIQHKRMKIFHRADIARCGRSIKPLDVFKHFLRATNGKLTSERPACVSSIASSRRNAALVRFHYEPPFCEGFVG